jgi:hypothetical protein
VERFIVITFPIVCRQHILLKVSDRLKTAKAAPGLSNPELADRTSLHRNKLDNGEGSAFVAQHIRLAFGQLGAQFMECGDESKGCWRLDFEWAE